MSETTTRIWYEAPAENVVAGAWLGLDDHTITATAEVGGCDCTLRIQCHKPEGAACRLGCPNERCEDACYCDEDAIDVGHCLAKEWIENDSPCELYGGATDVLISSGDRILVRWDGDGWIWALEPQDVTR
jgi:hypothetical protein